MIRRNLLYLFESRFFEKRETGALSVEEIKELMIQAQKDAYGEDISSSIYVDLETTLLLCLFFLYFPYAFFIHYLPKRRFKI